MTLNGFDISNLNGTAIITRALGGDFVICKCSEGQTYVDRLYAGFMAQIRAAGKLGGSYHFAHWRNDPLVEAAFYGRLNDRRSGEFEILDWEMYGQQADCPASVHGPWVAAFLRARPLAGLYTNYDMMNKIIASASSADLALIRSRIFWKATVGGTDPGNAYEFERGVSIWQYRDTQGIDEDRAFLTPDEWRRYADGNVEVPVSEIHADGSPPSDPAYHEVLKSWTTADGKLWVTYDAPPPPPPPPPVDPPPPPPPTGEPPVDITLAGDVWIGLLQYGTQDSDSVRRMQKVLNGISLPPPGNVTIDLKSGNYGPQTDDVVRTWQASIGDPVDPKGASSVGPKQAARLFAGTPVNLRIGSPGDATPPPPPPPPPASGVTTLFDGGRVTTPYGVPGSWAAGHHTGDDWACATGTHVRTTWSGPVVATNAWGAAYGNHVIQEITVNGETRRQAFCHLQSIEVRVGQMLHPGDWIGRADSTGNVTGPHVHLEQRTAPYGYANHDVKPVY